MSFLRGKSTSYTRFVLPESLTLQKIDQIVQAHEFTGLKDLALDANGFCSYRNLLDASIDRGIVQGMPHLWLTGVRRDVKKAPPALVQAQTAREIADARTISPNLSKFAQREIAQKVKFDLNQKAQARPSHAALVINLDTRQAYIDGMSAAHEWLHEMFGVQLQESLYLDSGLNSDYLLWCAWRAGHAVDTPCSSNGEITFREPKDAGASFDGQHDMNALLDYWVGEQKSTVASAGLTFAVKFDDDSYNVDVTLQSGTLKVCSLTFPEEIHEATGSLDDKLALRLGFVSAFEEALASDYARFAELTLQGDLPVEFEKLVERES